MTLGTPLETLSGMAQAIVKAHAATLGLPLETAAYARPVRPLHFADPVQTAAYQACLALGFISADAACVAKAWQNQTQRLGEFYANCWPTQAADFGSAAWPRADAFAACPHQLGLYAVLPTADWVKRMAVVGVPTLQLRFKSTDPSAIEREVRAAVEAVKGTSSLLFINDHWQAAIDTGAYGIHLGQEDLDAAGNANLEVIRSAGLRLGLSSHGYAEMLKADFFSPSYVAMGAVYATTLKRMVTPPQGPGRLAVYARLLHHYPLVGIGGINEARFDEVLPSGIGSIAVVRAIIASDAPEATAKRLMQRMTAKITL